MDCRMSLQKAGRQKVVVKPLELKKTVDLNNYQVVNVRETMALDKLTRQINLQEKSIS